MNARPGWIEIVLIVGVFLTIFALVSSRRSVAEHHASGMATRRPRRAVSALMRLAVTSVFCVGTVFVLAGVSRWAGNRTDQPVLPASRATESSSRISFTGAATEIRPRFAEPTNVASLSQETTPSTTAAASPQAADTTEAAPAEIATVTDDSTNTILSGTSSDERVVVYQMDEESFERLMNEPGQEFRKLLGDRLPEQFSTAYAIIPISIPGTNAAAPGIQSAELLQVVATTYAAAADLQDKAAKQTTAAQNAPEISGTDASAAPEQLMEMSGSRELSVAPNQELSVAPSVTSSTAQKPD
ncbi:MAG: hypothetical protein KDA85_15320, partial [Planctomycetaceae bacterium]|nr:hypothetical protein [Planctomycetaceae bacterium]